TSRARTRSTTSCTARAAGRTPRSTRCGASSRSTTWGSGRAPRPRRGGSCSLPRMAIELEAGGVPVAAEGRWARFGAFLVTFAAMLWVQRVAFHALALQWDLRVYLAAARAARAGLDPYA